MTAIQPRRPGGTADGGQFTSPVRADSDVRLADRAAVDGWTMKRYRILGQGSRGTSWIATLAHYGVPRLIASDPGDGSPVTLSGLDDNASAEFTRSAHHLIGDDPAAAGQLLHAIALSRDVDEESRLTGVDRDDILTVRLHAGAITDADHLLLHS